MSKQNKQRRWQLAKILRGLCPQCGKNPTGGLFRCEECKKKISSFSNKCRRCGDLGHNSKSCRAVIITTQ